MKKAIFKKMMVGGLLLGGLAGLVACGSDAGNSVVATGKVVKGPVTGAHVLDKNGVDFAVTDANGAFSMTNAGPYTTTGGTYVPLNADGTSGTPVAAPPMSAPVGYAQITPLSTIVASAPPAQQAAVEAQLTAALAKMGITDLKTADLSVKTSGNASAIVFAESVGAVLATAANTTASSDVKSAISSAITTALIDAVATLSSSTGTVNASAITSAITTAVTTTIAANTTITSAVPTLTTSISAATSTAATGATALPEGQLPTTTNPGTTGSTGGTGGTGGTSGLK